MKSGKFTVDFKVQAVEYLKNEGVTLKDAGARFGISPSTLSKWRTQYGAGLFHGSERSKFDAKDGEIRRLSSELRKRELELEILKKATAFFAKELA